jgi:hypothetical protein
MSMRLLLLTWLLPVASWGQTGKPAPISAVPAKQAAILPRPTIEQALTGMVNVRIMELAAPTYLYRHLRDSSNQPAPRELRRGLFVIVKKAYPRWLAVQLAVSPTQFSGDNTTYYIPVTATLGSKNHIVL